MITHRCRENSTPTSRCAAYTTTNNDNSNTAITVRIVPRPSVVHTHSIQILCTRHTTSFIMAVGSKQPLAPRPTNASAAVKPAPATTNAKKRKGRRYAKKKPKPTTQTNSTTTTTYHKPRLNPSSTAAPSDTWRRIVIDPELVALREVEAEGEGSGLIALEEISGRAFKGKVQVFTMDDVRAGAERESSEQKEGGKRKKRKRGELMPQLDVMEEERQEAAQEESEQQVDDIVQQEGEEREDEEAVEDEEMHGEAEVAEDEQDGVEFDIAELDGEEDEDTKAATLEAQRLLGQMRDEDDPDVEEEEEEEAVEAKADQMESEQVKVEQEEEEEDGDEAAVTTAQSQPSNKLPRPDLSTPPPTSAWDEFNLHPLLLHSLHTLGFHTPTPVQSACLPSALLQRHDIIAAAETGSGKTLTFALPILNGLLLSPPAGAGGGGVVALVLVPTRELALQVAMHVRSAAQYVDWLKCCVLVGGLSQQKQLRQLAAHPHILIATPGRLCELIVEGEVKGWHTLRYLVLDEADRMVERGLGAEVEKVMTAIDRQRTKVLDDGGKVSKLQHFFFSATLSLPDTGRENLKLKKANKQNKRKANDDDNDEHGMVGYFQSLCSSLEGSGRPHIVDLTTKRRVVGGLSEYIIPCVTEDKDYYVYALLLQQPADTKLILFVNAISCLRRLSSLLTLMTLPVFPLHAEMQQRQRLKNLDRFTAATTSAILLCTDVAARGLDLPAVPMVVHYQLPGSADVYIHRVGRTARAGRVGVSVSLVSEEDGRAWHRINTVLRGSSQEEVERWKVEDRLMAVSRERMTIARKLDRLLNRQRQQKHTSDWLTRQAQEMDMIVDDELLQSGKRQAAGKGKRGKGGDEEEEEREREEARRLQKELSGLLKRRVEEEKKHARFFTLNVVEEMEKRNEEQKKRAAKEEQDNKKKQKTAAATSQAKPQATKTVPEQKAKVEPVAEESDQNGHTVTMSEEQPGRKVETVEVLEQKQQNGATKGKLSPSELPQSSKSKGTPKPKQAAKQVEATNAVVQLQINAISQSIEEKGNIPADKPVQPVTALRSHEQIQVAAPVSVVAKEEKAPNDSTAQPVAASAGDAAGETKKLGKRAKKNLRKQKQKLAATTVQPSPGARQSQV